MTTNEPRTQNDSGTADNYIRVPVSGGVLVYEPRPIGKELVGFAEITDRADLTDALRARGLGHGALRNLPVLDE